MKEKADTKKSARTKVIAIGFFCLVAVVSTWAVMLVRHDYYLGGPAKNRVPDRIVVEKSARKLSLLRRGKTIKIYRVALGGAPVGAKEEEGDMKTPEGVYTIDYRNPQSDYHLSLHISYPGPEDVRRAAIRGVSAGCDIMIHGLPNGQGSIGAAHCRSDWTAGCIAVTDEEIEELWRLVPDGTLIEIRP